MQHKPYRIGSRSFGGLPVIGLTVNMDRLFWFKPSRSGHEWVGDAKRVTGPERDPACRRKRGCRGQRKGRSSDRRRACKSRRSQARREQSMLAATVKSSRPPTGQVPPRSRAVRRLARTVAWSVSFLNRALPRFRQEVQRRKELLDRIAEDRRTHRRGGHRSVAAPRRACAAGHPDPVFGRVMARTMVSFQRKLRLCGLAAASKLLKEWNKEKPKGGTVDLFNRAPGDGADIKFRLGIRTGTFESSRRRAGGPPAPPARRAMVSGVVRPTGPYSFMPPPPGL